MPTQVQLPDGSTGEFPDGMSQEQIEGVLAKQFPAPPPPDTRPQIEQVLTPTMHSADQGVLGNIGTGIGNFAKGAGHMLTHPEELVTGAVMGSPPAVFANDLRDAYKHIKGEPNAGDEMRAHPMENLEYAAGEAAPLMLAGGAESLPSKARANAVFSDLAGKAADVPVSMDKTAPAMEGFRDYVRTGGRQSMVARKLGNAIDSGEPMNFPEARQFYTNISRATARPGVFRRMIESPAAPDMRRNLGNVRSAFNEDITNSLQPLGQSDRYTDALREYGRAARLNKAAKIGGAVVGEEALRRSGILGKVAGGVANLAGQ